MVNKMTTVMLFMAISIMKFVQSVCHEISIAHKDFVAMSAGISGFYRGIALRINITLWVRMIINEVEPLEIIFDQ